MGQEFVFRQPIVGGADILVCRLGRQECLPHRPVALVRIVAIMIYIIQPRWMEWSALDLPAWLRWTGVGFGVAASWLAQMSMFRSGDFQPPPEIGLTAAGSRRYLQV